MPDKINKITVRLWIFKELYSKLNELWKYHLKASLLETPACLQLIGCHEAAFQFPGGVVKIDLLDNLKSGVLEAQLYEPVLNPNYVKYSEHAGFTPLPCRVATPQHKGKVESGVNYLQESCLKGKQFESLEAQNAHLIHWNQKVMDS